MAKAPRPGARAAATSRFCRLTLDGQTLDVHPASLTLADRAAVRQVTGGLSLESLIGSPGVDTLVVLWWLARRGNGEPTVTIKEAEYQVSAATAWDVEWLDESTEPSDDPEGSGPG